MADDTHEVIVKWLNDAYAMEQAQEKILERFIDDFDDHLGIQDELRRQLEETRQHAEDVTACIERLGGKVSAVKSMFGTLSGAMQGVQTAPFKDEKIKNMLMLHAGGHFGHACYVALAIGARELGQDDVAEACERIAEDEERVAEWAVEQLPEVVRHVVKAEAAKHEE